MRYALCAAAIIVLATIDFGAGAQAQISYSGEGDCNKGMFWPFVRSPGDCLTDTERRSGMSGTYRESEVREPDDGAAASAPVQALPDTQQAIPAPPEPRPSSSATAPIASPPAPASSTPGAAIQPAAARAEPSAEPVRQQDPSADGRATYTGEGGCTKGVFWPFVRRSGDCLTDTEIRSGQTGTYQ